MATFTKEMFDIYYHNGVFDLRTCEDVVGVDAAEITDTADLLTRLDALLEKSDAILAGIARLEEALAEQEGPPAPTDGEAIARALSFR